MHWLFIINGTYFVSVAITEPVSGNSGHDDDIILRSDFCTAKDFKENIQMKTKLSDFLKNGRHATLIILLIWVIYNTAKITFLTLSFKVITVDVAIFLDGLLSLSRGELYNNAIQHIQLYGLAHYSDSSNPVISGFAFHQNYIMYLLVPLYYLFPDILLLQLTPVFVVALSSWLFFLIASERLQDTRKAFYCFCTFLIIPSIVRCTLGFIPDCFGILFLTLYFYFLMREKEWLAFMALIFLALCRENYFVIITGLGLYSMIFKKQLRFGSAVLLLGIVHFFVGTIFMPDIFSPDGTNAISSLNIFHKFGGSMSEIAKNILLHPLDAISYMLRRKSLIYLLSVGAPFIILSWRNPLNLVIVPPLMINSLSGMWYAVNVNTHHTFILMPIIFMAWLQELGKLNRNRNIWIAVAVSLCILSLTVFQTYNTPLSLINILNRSMSSNGALWEDMRERGRHVDELLEKIPDGSAVAIDIRATTEYFFSISPRVTTTVFPRGAEQAQYIIRYEMLSATPEVKKKLGNVGAEAQLADSAFFSANKHLWKEIYSYNPGKTERISLWQKSAT